MVIPTKSINQVEGVSYPENAQEKDDAKTSYIFS